MESLLLSEQLGQLGFAHLGAFGFDLGLELSSLFAFLFLLERFETRHVPVEHRQDPFLLVRHGLEYFGSQIFNGLLYGRKWTFGGLLGIKDLVNHRLEFAGSLSRGIEAAAIFD